MPIGRPRIPGTEAERAEARRAKVRANVQAFRRRQKEKKSADQGDQRRTIDLCPIQPRQTPAGGAHDTGLPTIATPPNGYSHTYEPSVFPPEDPEFWLWAIPAEMGARLEGTTYQNAFIETLHHRFVQPQTINEETAEGPRKRLSICCSIWITSVDIEIGRPETEVLMEALLAASLAVAGRDRNDSDMSLHGAYMQTRALQRLRYSLTRYQEGDSSICPTTLSLTALTCAMSELVANKSWDNFNRHLLGVGALIFHGGVDRLDRRAAQEHFYGYRAIQTPFLFMDRQRAFLSNPEWTHFPWRKDVELALHPLHLMLDIALKILPEIVKQDMPKKWKVTCLKERLDKAWVIVEELDEWERQLRLRHHGVLYTKMLSTWGGVYKCRLEFPDTSTAIAFAMYTAVRVHVATLIANVSDEMRLRMPMADIDSSSALLDALRWSRLACQSLEYFHTGDAPKAAGRIVTLWPLETAWELFGRLHFEGSADVSREIAWCRTTAERHTSLGIPPFQWR
ncbi:hypothetical protein H2200_006901 [Cladophialophora chaetospira]|uniref:Uncharacterized protein n=1 Tax=Cladophialophora chaetospira TaxID=386627 RepID=A0AA38X980_9EURO|nr:hypothetical protein H2200_006901 [Cladophialophora chaetospira]